VVNEQEPILDVLPVEEEEDVVIAVKRRRRRQESCQPAWSIYLPQEPKPELVTLDRILGTILMGSGFFFLLTISIIPGGNILVAVLLGGFFLVAGLGRFFMPDFMNAMRTAGLGCLVLGCLLAAAVNAAEKKGAGQEMGEIPFLFAYIGAVLFSAMGAFGLFKG
jgi:hypothetical protein